MEILYIFIVNPILLKISILSKINRRLSYEESFVISCIQCEKIIFSMYSKSDKNCLR